METSFDPTSHTHRRFNPLTKEYVLVSPHRTKRPWLGQTEPPQTATLPEYDPSCYLCPSNARSGGARNPNYDHTFAFENDFAAVLPEPQPEAPVPLHPLMTVEPVHGACDVLMFHPRHDLTVARLDVGDIECIIREWIRIYETRGSQPGIKYVQIFENKGSMMGCSNPHPHGQIWSLSAVPTVPSQELVSLQEYAEKASKAEGGDNQSHHCLLCEYVRAEVEEKERVVVLTEHWVALVPWWAIWPFEILLLPYQRHIDSLSQLTEAEVSGLADVFSRITRQYDNLFLTSFPYSMGIHQRPTPPKEGEDEFNKFAHLHFHFEPPLLRSASVRKFLVGYEMMAEPQRDLTPEQAASRLRECSEAHYLEK